MLEIYVNKNFFEVLQVDYTTIYSSECARKYRRIDIWDEVPSFTARIQNYPSIEISDVLWVGLNY